MYVDQLMDEYSSAVCCKINEYSLQLYEALLMNIQIFAVSMYNFILCCVISDLPRFLYQHSSHQCSDPDCLGYLHGHDLRGQRIHQQQPQDKTKAKNACTHRTHCCKYSHFGFQV